MLVGLGQQTHLLRVKTQLITLVINKLNTLEEFVVEDNTVTQFTQHRTHLLCDSVHLIVAICFEDVEEHTNYAVEQQTGAIERYDRVLERRLCLVVNDCLYLCFVLLDSLFKCRQIMFVLHLIKSRYTIRCVRLIYQGVGTMTCY